MENLNNVPSTGTFGNSINQVNQNFGLVKGAIENVEGRTIRSKGLFPTQAALTAAYPSPQVGDYAYVGSSLPATVYDCLVAGTWHNTGQTGGSETVDLSNYSTKSETSTSVANSLAQATARTGYGEATASNNAYSVTITNYTLPANGGVVRVKMPTAATGAATLNITDTGAKTIWYNGLAVTSENTWGAGEVISVFYDGTKYMASNSQGGGGKAEKIKYDNSQSGLASQNVQGALDEIQENLTELEGEITEPGTEVILTLYPNVMYTINADGVWATVYNDNHSIFVPMEDGEYTLTATSSTQALYTVLTSNATPVPGATPTYATGYSNRISIPAGRTATVQGRSGLYLWLRNDTDIDGAMAPLVTHSSGGSRLDAIAQLVPEPVYTSLYSTIHFIINKTINKWASSDSLYYSKIIPMQDGEYTLSAVNSNSVYTVLSSNTPPVDGQTPAYATGYDKLIYIEQGNSEKVKGISGLYLYIRSDDDTTYGVFPPEIKFLAYSERINPIEDFVNNINTYETIGNNTDAIILGYSSRGNDIYIAASDSSEVAKASADFVCDGVNDEIELKAACLALVGNGILHMAEGNYYIDSFFTAADGGQPYIMKPQLAQNNITIVCDFNQPIRKASVANPWSANDITLGAIIRITDNCYNSLDSDTLYTIIRACASNGSRRYPATFLNVRGIGFKIPDNQKQIICIDGYFATAMNINRCAFNFVQDSRQPSSLHNGVMNCIGIRGTQGNSYGVYNHITDCIAWGCGQGFAIGGEHLLVDQCLTRFCRYGYTFNNYSVANNKFIHPIILLNCSDEASFNLPLFGNNELLQAIYMYGFNIEHESQYFNLFQTEGNYMRELTPGQWRGRVEFTMNMDNNANVINYKLWASDGSGVNVKSINDAQKFICTTSERNSYYPTAGQIVYDTTLGKPVMCIDAANKTWVDFTGATV